MPITPQPSLAVAEARRILRDPALCNNFPSLRKMAFYVAATAAGRPARQIMLRTTPGDAA